MTIKYTPDLKNTIEARPSRLSSFAFSSSSYSSLKPMPVPLAFHNLKPNTKYRIFVKNSEETVGSKQEDVTAFCVPYGESIQQNNNQRTFSDFLSTPSGELFVNVKPFGTDGLNITAKNWSDYWRFVYEKSFFSDAGRNNFIIVESSKTVGDVGDKQKTIRGQAPASISVPLFNEKDGDKYLKQNFRASFIQTFFIDPNAAQFSKTVDLTDISLYFRNKPERKNNTSGITDPSVVIAIIDVEDQKPIITRQYKSSIVKRHWSEISASSDASVAAVFAFQSSVRLEVGRTYGIAVSFDDPDYALWEVRAGDLLVGTNDISSGSGKSHRGNLYELTNAAQKIDNANFDTVYSEKASTDLKFDIHVAEYNLEQIIDIDFVNNNYEFLIIDTPVGFHGGEQVYQVTANSNGTITTVGGSTKLVGNGTVFTDLVINEKLVLIDSANAEQTEVVTIAAIRNNTEIELQSPAMFSRVAGNYQRAVIATVEYLDVFNRRLFLSDSNAGLGASTLPKKQFKVDEPIVGIESNLTAEVKYIDGLPMSVFSTNIDLDLPSTFSVESQYNLAKKDNGGFLLDNSDLELNLLSPNYNTKYDSFVLSKSLEVDSANNLFNSGQRTLSSGDDVTIPKSLQYRLSFKNETPRTKSFESPELEIVSGTSATSLWLINNDTENEHTNDGEAVTKYISKKLAFKEGNSAEDIRVICNAYRPTGTDFKVYAKILNEADPDAFDDKLWTELEIVSGQGQFGDPEDLFDFREYEFGFPSSIPTLRTTAGVVSATVGNTTISGSGTLFDTAGDNKIEAGEIIKIYDPLFPQNYEIFSVASVTNNTTLVLTEPVTNTNIGTGDSGLKVDKLFPQNVAFNNTNNFNIVRYFDSRGAHYDTYTTVAIKIVLLANDPFIVPRVDDYRVIGVSA